VKAREIEREGGRESTAEKEEEVEAGIATWDGAGEGCGLKGRGRAGPRWRLSAMSCCPPSLPARSVSCPPSMITFSLFARIPVLLRHRPSWSSASLSPAQCRPSQGPVRKHEAVRAAEGRRCSMSRKRSRYSRNIHPHILAPLHFSLRDCFHHRRSSSVFICYTCIAGNCRRWLPWLNPGLECIPRNIVFCTRIHTKI
jgi:hypothetical protein